MKHLLFAVFALLLLTQCKKNEPEIVICGVGMTTPFEIAQPFTVSPYLVFQEKGNSNPLSLLFDNVIEDSRCPTGAQCITNGEVKVALKYWYKNETLTDTLALPGLPDPNNPPSDTAIFKNYRIILQAVNPHPSLGDVLPFPLDAYTLDILVTNN